MICKKIFDVCDAKKYLDNIMYIMHIFLVKKMYQNKVYFDTSLIIYILMLENFMCNINKIFEYVEDGNYKDLKEKIDK